MKYSWDRYVTKTISELLDILAESNDELEIKMVKRFILDDYTKLERRLLDTSFATVEDGK